MTESKLTVTETRGTNITDDPPNQAEVTRRSLIGRLRHWEDQASWQDFFNTYWRLIYATGRKAGLSDAEAQDAVQDTIVAVVKNIKTFRYDRKRCKFKTWLMMIARQRIIWQIRKRVPAAGRFSGATNGDAAEEEPPDIESLPDPQGIDLEAIWEREWKENLVTAALERVKSRVSARQFQLFDLYVLQGCPVEEITATLKVSRTSVYLAKHRISALLKSELLRLEKKGL